MIDRRRLLLTAAATAVAAPSLAPDLARAAAAVSDADTRLNALLDGWFEADIDESPERATNLGLDKGARAGLSSKLSEAGPGAIRKDRDKAISRWATLRAFDQTGLSRPRIPFRHPGRNLAHSSDIGEMTHSGQNLPSAGSISAG